MKKILFSATILAFAGITTISASNHHVNIQSKAVLQDTTDTSSTPTTTPADTSSTKPDTTGTPKS